ncbi:MAG: HAMP domain-containing sensor histidine kinase [Propionicimonas sp.]|uniref:sensor histidine kinase n=1 Tax=Propionicimonas sp. TaxID=1955623 RepID=UPI003D103CF0
MTVPALPAAATAPSPMGKGTLSRQLVLRTTALVALVTVGLSLFTALAIFQILQNQLDEQLQAAASRPPWRTGTGSGTGGTGGAGPVDPSGAGLIRMDLINGTWWLNLPDGVTKEAAADLVSAATARPSTVTVEGAGLYRVILAEGGDSTRLVGLPYSAVTGPMTNVLVMAGLLTSGAILISYVAARRVVEQSLRPLTRLAATATQVSNLPLESGEGHVPIRVAPGDANPASEVGRVGLAFNHMLDNVEHALAARHQSETKVRQFVADASHELRNPLASIRGYAELTRRGSEELPEDAAHALGRIEAESERMSALVQDLLLLARLDSEPTLDIRPTDLTEIVLNAVSDARAASPEHSWTLDLPDEPVTALADAHGLHQVVANLLANARTHTPAGTRVQTALRAEDGWAVISVTDNGPGVPPEIQGSVFERFTRADVSRVRKAGGSSTGLGLAIVSAVVHAHGGQVALESEPGRTTFSLRVPLA